jgi:ribonuclease HI
LNRKTIETILPAAQCPRRKRNFTIKIAGSRKESIKREKEDDAEFKVFSDGSGLEDGIGAAAVLYTKERHTPIGHLKAFLGPPAKHNTYEAETVGAILATWLLSKCPETTGKKVSLYIDNQSVLASISNPKATSGQHLIRHLTTLANALACNLSLHWISSHSKVKGNEKVDELAKEAASGRASTRASLPHILRTSLPTSASATRQDYHRRLKKMWDDIWADSDRSQRLNEIDDNFPFNSFRKRTYRLTRHQASLMNQIRCGHIPLNGYLSMLDISEHHFTIHTSRV